MKVRTGLTDYAHDILVSFLADRLRVAFNPTFYAECLISEKTDWEGSVVFSIPWIEADTREPASITFCHDEHFVYAEMST